jgi:hypothetical protein
MEAKKSMLFFSYARADSEFALRLAKDLRSAGASIWLDQLDLSPGVPWDDAIQEALRACPALLVVLSPTSVASRNVMDEVSFALQNDKEVVPIMYHKCDIPFRLGRLNYIDFSSDYNAGFEQLRRALALDSPHVSEPGPRSPLDLQSTLAYILEHRAVAILAAIPLFIVIALVYHHAGSNPNSSKQKIARSTPGYQPTVTGNSAQVPNTTISGATLITEGATIDGSIVTADESRFFKFVPSGRKTRVILRKRFLARLKILDRNEADIASGLEPGDDAVTLAFDSTPNALYYVEVSPFATTQSGDFELVVREE